MGEKERVPESVRECACVCVCVDLMYYPHYLSCKWRGPFDFLSLSSSLFFFFWFTSSLDVFRLNITFIYKGDIAFF